MTTDPDKLPLPPGNRTFPLLGETLPFLGDAFTFIARRVAKHGPVFRTHLLGRPTVILAGPSVSHVFIDEELVLREGSMPGHVRELFGGQSLPLLDGEAHRTRKGQVLAAFGREALASYVPAMQALVEAALDRWAKAEEVRAAPELKRLAISVIARNVASLGEGPDLEALLAGYQTVLTGFSAVPVAIPGTTYTRALAARDGILTILRRVVAEHREHPRDDGLGRILAEKGPDGATIADDEVVKELHHVFIAGYIVFAELCALLTRLVEHPELQAALVAEVQARAPSGPLAARALAALPLVSRVVQETKRITPVVPIAFGRAKKTFELSGYRIPEGTMLYWAPWNHDQDPEAFPRPEVFDPERFSEARAEHRRHELAYAPQGMGPALGHTCPGFDYASLMMQVFLVSVLRGFSWSLPEQRLGLDFAKLPPEPLDGLRVVFHQEQSASAPISRAPKTLRAAEHAPDAELEAPRLGPAALRALATVIWADGVMTADEASTLVHVARASGLSEEEVQEVARVTRERAADEREPLQLDAAASEHLFSLACLLAASDGSIDPRERDAVAAFGARLGLDEEARARASRASHAVAQSIGASSKALAALAAEASVGAASGA